MQEYEDTAYNTQGNKATQPAQEPKQKQPAEAKQ
jgi:hypothetical protein